MNIPTLREHWIRLHGDSVALRPMAETDWAVLARWNSDAEVLWYSEGDDVSSYSLGDVKRIYREVSQAGCGFISELSGQAMGECWLQEMNLERILATHRGLDCRRIDLIIGEKALWGHGYGTETIGLLTKVGFEDEDADLMFGCGVADYNLRSRRAFERIGHSVDQCREKVPVSKARYEYDLVLSRGDYSRSGKA